MTNSLLPYLPRLLVEWSVEAPEVNARTYDGTIVFVDISGFTKMSERLAKKGKVGSEEVTDVLTGTFSRLLAAAYEDGGGLLKFGGDALLLFFSGPRHEERGVHAAASMRRKLREVGRIPTSAGFVTLRMSIGVHSGEFDMFLVGSRHRELVLAGPGVSAACLMEHSANAGEILLSAATAATLDPALLGAPRDGGVLLRKVPPPPAFVPSDAAADEYVGVDLSAYVPEAYRDDLQEGSVESEHRQVTVAFVHFDGTDELLVREGKAAVAERLDRLVSATQDAVARHELCFVSSDADVDGGKLILMAGAPRATDNDEERMLRAVREIADADTGLEARIGVNRGPVFVGNVGPPFRRSYTIIGDAVNLAARVMAKAEPGEVLATHGVIDSSGADIATEPLEPFFVKGKAQPVTASRIGAIGGARAVAPTIDLPLVGRQRELDALLGAVADADAGHGRLALVTGEPGAGKTRLLTELRDRTESRRIVTAACEQYGAETAYLPFRRLLRSVAGVDDALEPVAAGVALTDFVESIAPDLLPRVPLLAIPFGAEVAPTAEADEIAPEFRMARMRDAVVDLFYAALPDPTVIIIEDAHWIDDASGGLIERLAAAVGEQPWLLCVTARGDVPWAWPEEQAVVLLALDRLDPAAAELLAAAAADAVLLPQVQVQLAAKRSDGHPLFLLELVNAIAAGRTGDELPDTVEALITARIDRLPSAERTMLSQASVLGSPFSVALLAAVIETDEARVVAVLGRLADVVEPIGPGMYQFRKSLFGEVCYEHLPYRRRRALHQLAGEAILQQHPDDLDEHAGILSLHFDRSHDPARAWHFARLAGERAQASFANVEAATLFKRAVESGRQIEIDPAELATTWEALGDVQQLAGLYDEASEAFGHARRLEPAAAARLMRKQGVLQERRGRYSQALRWYGRAAVEADDAERVELTVARAVARQRQGRYADSIALCREAVVAAEQLGDRASLAYAYFLLHAAHIDLGTGEAGDYAAKALALYEELGDLIGQANVEESLGIEAYWEGNWDESYALYERSGDLRDRAGHVVYARFATNNMAEILSDRGDWAEADSLFAEARRVWRAARYPFGVALATGNLGRSAARAGRHAEARVLLDDALAQWTEIGSTAFRLETEARLAELDVFERQFASALERTARTLTEDAAGSGTAMLRAFLHRSDGCARMQAGELESGRAVLLASVNEARDAAAPYEEALTLDALAASLDATGGGDDAKGYRDEAQAIFTRLGVHRVATIPLPM